MKELDTTKIDAIERVSRIMATNLNRTPEYVRSIFNKLLAKAGWRFEAALVDWVIWYAKEEAKMEAQSDVL